MAVSLWESTSFRNWRVYANMVYCSIKGPPWACLCLYFSVFVTSKVANITAFLSISSQLLLSSNCVKMAPKQVKKPILQFHPIHVLFYRCKPPAWHQANLAIPFPQKKNPSVNSLQYCGNRGSQQINEQYLSFHYIWLDGEQKERIKLSWTQMDGQTFTINLTWQSWVAGGDVTLWHKWTEYIQATY